jgi:hypothetical protein
MLAVSWVATKGAVSEGWLSSVKLVSLVFRSSLFFHFCSSVPFLYILSSSVSLTTTCFRHVLFVCIFTLHASFFRFSLFLLYSYFISSPYLYRSHSVTSSLVTAMSTHCVTLQLLEALCCKQEWRSLDSRWSHCIFQLTLSFQVHYGPGVDSASNRNEYQESSCEWRAVGASGWQAHRCGNLPHQWYSADVRCYATLVDFISMVTNSLLLCYVTNATICWSYFHSPLLSNACWFNVQGNQQSVLMLCNKCNDLLIMNSSPHSPNRQFKGACVDTGPTICLSDSSNLY